MADLLFELGCEELPASFVRDTQAQLEAAVVGRLEERGLKPAGSETLGTPRRILLRVQGIPGQQEDTVKVQRGPAAKAAFDAEGKPTPALIGFCRGQGISPDDLEREGDYMMARIPVVGKPAMEVLQEVLPDAIRSLSFPKSMRWGRARMRFARPIRWILASLDGQTVAFDIEGVASGAESRGHRFKQPESFPAGRWDDLLQGLRSRFVEPDPVRREGIIREESQKIASGTVEFSDDLVEENVYLTEWPMPVEGTFPASFLELPDPVLVTAMAKHERFFPVRGADGKLLNKFISITNNGDAAVVASGNEWVLNARFNDAKFFYDEDKKVSLEEFLSRTERMTFQEKLGSVRQRADRLAALTEAVCRHAGFSTEGARDAGLFAKADLSSGLVSELSSLQGVVGGEYALREGKGDVVAGAIARHYSLGRCLPADAEEKKLGLALLVADQIDKLVGYLGLGLAPSGSSDPYGLRRAVSLLVESGLSGSFVGLFETSEGLYLDQNQPIEKGKALSLLGPIFAGRYEVIYESERHDLLAAALCDDLAVLANPDAIKARLEAMKFAAQHESHVQAATRPINIVASAEAKGIAISGDASTMASATGEALLAAAQAAKNQPIQAFLPGLASHINQFFEAEMVMVDDEKVRDGRLSMLREVRELLLSHGDFTKIVFEG